MNNSALKFSSIFRRVCQTHHFKVTLRCYSLFNLFIKWHCITNYISKLILKKYTIVSNLWMWSGHSVKPHRYLTQMGSCEVCLLYQGDIMSLTCVPWMKDPTWSFTDSHDPIRFRTSLNSSNLYISMHVLTIYSHWHYCVKHHASRHHDWSNIVAIVVVHNFIGSWVEESLLAGTFQYYSAYGTPL